LPECPLGIWVGRRLHKQLDQRQLCCACQALLTVRALALLCDALRGHNYL
jgi:uncharacterized protein